MANLTVMPFDRKVVMRSGESVLEALHRTGFNIEGPCNGKGICGKCRVVVAASAALPATPHKLISEADTAAGVRLACRLVPETDLTVELPGDFALDARILEGERISGVTLNPAVQLRRTGGQVRMTYAGADEVPLTPWQDGWTPKGMAVDIGTTTLVVTLYDLASGAELGTASGINPQTRFGHDVLSRIQHATTDGGLGELADAVRLDVNRLADHICQRSGCRATEILDVVVGGNTTMLQLAAAIDPEPLGHVPFTVDIAGGCTYPVAQFGLNAHPLARVYVPPIIHAFIGTDITAGFLAAHFLQETQPTLFIDIGTNGEMGLISNGQVLATSTAAGPAFEGMGVSHGMRAAPGAIEKASVNEERLIVETIDAQPARGICGSGIIDVMAALVKTRVVDPSGRMKLPEQADQVQPVQVGGQLERVDDKPAFRLADGVFFTQNDVRQMQLAKGAIRTGVDMLVSQAGLAVDDIAKVVLAGAFGFHLRPESLETIGLLPAGYAERVIFAGNTSKTGSAMMVLDVDLRKALEHAVVEVRHVPLAESMDFQNLFVTNLAFPDD